MSAAECVSADPRGLPAAPRCSRSSRKGPAGPSDNSLSRRSSSSSPFAGRMNDDRPRRRSGGGRSQAGPASSASDAPWNAVMEALAELWEDVNKLKAGRSVSSPAHTVVYDGAGTSTGEQRPRSLAYFSGFHDSASEGEPVGQDPGGSALLQAAKAFGPAELVSADIDPKIAEMVNFVKDDVSSPILLGLVVVVDFTCPIRHSIKE
ncbi:hypothetical protein E2C01_026454 [Portunus trituberculatus]|uniref:Uncharacterized protein n=1 Tax=Portunus trituberculatus TaxID=210409 RepID=A0A5B7EFY7_PORTR|nr:hypothetical protein [Portunus trituberculatus]